MNMKMAGVKLKTNYIAIAGGIGLATLLLTGCAGFAVDPSARAQEIIALSSSAIPKSKPPQLALVSVLVQEL